MSPTVTIEAPQTIPEDVSEAVIPTETPKKNVAMSKGPRKTPVKKSKAEAAVHVSDDMPAEPTEGGAEITTPAKPVKKPRKTPVKKENVKPATCKEGEEAGSADEPTTPKAAAPKKRAPKKKADPVTPGTPGEDADMMATTPPGRGATKSSVKKRAAVKAADDETPTKKAKAAAGDISGKRTKTAAERFPESWSDFSEQDKLIVNMKKSGKPWPEIESAWTAITRVAPGKDSLRKRFAKLAAVAVEFDEDDVGSAYLLLPLLFTRIRTLTLSLLASQDRCRQEDGRARDSCCVGKDEARPSIRPEEAQQREVGKDR
ncbi:unnamed protein product [Diplocarpon coronariae]